MAEFDTLRGDVSDRQREILTAIWRYFLEQHQWIPIRLLHKLFGGKASARPRLEQLGGSIVFESEANRTKHYQLTLLGILLTDEGEDLEKLLASYLRYAQEKCELEPLRTDVTSQEAEADLGLAPEQSARLGYLVCSGPFSSGSTSSPQGWRADVPENIEDLPPDHLAYVRECAVDGYDPQAPVDIVEKQRYYSTKRREPSRTEKAGTIESTEQMTEVERILGRIRKEINISRIEPGFKDTALHDLEQARLAYTAGAFKACIVMLGAVLEGMMLGTIQRQEVLAAIVGSPNPPKAVKQIGLKDPSLSDKIADELGFEDYKNIIHDLIPEIQKLHVTGIQDFRNAIHPWKVINDQAIYADQELTQTRAMHHLTALEILSHQILSWTP
jgi:hypothetical protein